MKVKHFAVCGIAVAIVAIATWVFCREPLHSNADTPAEPGKGLIKNVWRGRDAADKGKSTPTGEVGVVRGVKNAHRDEKQNISAPKSALADRASELAEPTLTPQTLEELRDIFARSMDGKTSDRHFLQALQCYRPETVLAGAKIVLRNGTPQEKQHALWAVGMTFSTDTQHALDRSVPPNEPESEGQFVVKVSDAPDPEPGSEDTQLQLAQRSSDIVATVKMGIGDESRDVRETAFEVMRSLPEEERGILSAQIINGGDADMKVTLMDALKGSTADADVRMLLQGMASEDEAVRGMARDNLRDLSGQNFATFQEADAWYGEHRETFQQSAGNETKQDTQQKE